MLCWRCCRFGNGLRYVKLGILAAGLSILVMVALYAVNLTILCKRHSWRDNDIRRGSDSGTWLLLHGLPCSWRLCKYWISWALVRQHREATWTVWTWIRRLNCTWNNAPSAIRSRMAHLPVTGIIAMPAGSTWFRRAAIPAPLPVVIIRYVVHGPQSIVQLVTALHGDYERILLKSNQKFWAIASACRLTWHHIDWFNFGITTYNPDRQRMMNADNLRLTFNPGTPIENPALRGISLRIEAGEFVTVIGTNGAGKSTFLNAVAWHDSGR